jgi:hypothetical protein
MEKDTGEAMGFETTDQAQGGLTLESRAAARPVT